jgi:hypothetical protein
MIGINIDILDSGACKVMTLLEMHGHKARICGGAARDLLIGEIPKDWDIATTAKPERVEAIFKKHGFLVIQTGLQHGTVTVVVNHVPYEITTLRVDTDTDGRHATVEFTEDWKQDSLRRDFTINAMYIDSNGIVHDYHNGILDIKRGKLNFVGNTMDRLREDYLRIMRFYRFWARGWTPDSIDVHLVKGNLPKLNNISRERIWSELKLILKVVNNNFRMEAPPLVASLVREPVDFGKFMTAVSTIDPRAEKREILLFASFFNNVDFAMKACLSFKASKEEMRLVKDCITSFSPAILTPRDLVAEFGKSQADLIALLRFNEKRGEVFSCPPLIMPKIADDLIIIGVKGPEIGKLISVGRVFWKQTDYLATKDEILTHLKNRYIKK